MWRMECEESLHLMPELSNSLSLIVSGNSDEEIAKGWKSLMELEQNGLLQEIINLDDAMRLMRGILRGNILNLHEVPKLMVYFAKYVKKKDDSPCDDCKFIINDCVDFIHMAAGKDITLLTSMVKVLSEHPVYRATPTSDAKAWRAIIMSLGSFPMPKDSNKISEFRNNIAKIQESLKIICKTSNGFGNSDFITVCLENVYNMISDIDRKTDPGPGLIAVLELVEPRVIFQAVQSIMSVSKNDAELEKALKVLCNWVPQWLKVSHLSQWIVQFITGLEYAEKYDILMSVANSCLKTLLICMCLPLAHAEASVLVSLILRKQPRPDLFDKIVMMKTFEFVFKSLQKQKSESLHSSLQNLVNAIKTLIERFPNNSIYSSLEESFPVPPQMDVVKRCCEETVWSDNCDRLPYPEIYIHSLSEHGKVGLTNLGNTCYMNSVLQALAMTRQFSQEVMKHKTIFANLEENGTAPTFALAEEAASIMPKLQNLFALLSYSKRRSLSPTEVLTASRPEYFTPGQQQDSSEFLCHLLDVLYEQEKSLLRQNIVGVTDISTGSSGKGKRNSDVVTPDHGAIKRWTTEEDLSEGVSLERKTSQSLGDFSKGEDEEQLGQMQQGTSELSDSHSDSTDSGIQSVDGGGGSEESAIAQSILVHRVFGGESKITYQCAQCDTSSHNTDRFRDLQLCFPQEITDNQEVSVQDLMNYYLTPEKLTGENKYRCDKCTKLCDAQRIIKILRAPIHLILTLKHFHYDPETRLRTKLRHKVTYNETIQLPVSSGSPNVSSPIAETYRLYAAVVHSGYSMDYGHYITYARDSKQNWYKFNDSYVSRTSLEDFNGLEPPDTPYILFYEKTNPNDTSRVSGEDDETSTPDLSTLSKHIRNLVEKDAQAYEQELRHQAEKKRAQRASPSGRVVAPSLKRHDNSDDDNPPPSSCRGPMDITANRFLF